MLISRSEWNFCLFENLIFYSINFDLVSIISACSRHDSMHFKVFMKRKIRFSKKYAQLVV